MNILSIYQDEVGTMWFGSLEGLNSFNGQEISVFRPSMTTKGLTQNEIFEICGNRKGVIYIKARKDLVKYDLYKQKFHCLQYGNINDIFYSNDTLWMATGDQVLAYTGENQDSLSVFYHLDRQIAAAKIFTTESRIFLSAENLLYSISKKTREVERVFPINDDVKCFFKDSKNNFWIGTSKSGLYKITPQNDTIHFTHSGNKNSISNNLIRSVVEDNTGTIWVGTFFGLNKYDVNTNKWTVYTQAGNKEEQGLSHNSIYALYKDKQGTIWIGTYFGGVNYFNPEKHTYDFFGSDPKDPHSVSYPFVGKMTEDKTGNLWVCTEGGGLNFFDKKTKTFKKYIHNERGNAAIGHNNLKCLWYDTNRDMLYVGTHTGGLSILDVKKDKFRTLRHDAADKLSLPDDIVNEMQYYKNELVVLTHQGISKMNLQTETFHKLSGNEKVNKILTRRHTYETFLIDSQDRLWLSLFYGGLMSINLKTNEIKEYHYNEKDPSGIGKFKTIKIFESSQRRLFFCTIGSGLFEYDANNDNFINYTSEQKEILSNYCYYIAELPYKYLIILHGQGVTFFNPVTSRLETSYEFSEQSFNQGSTVYVTRDEKMFFGGNNSLVSFGEEILQNVIENSNNMYFNHLFINNKEVLPDDNTGILSKAIMFSDNLNLKHNQNNIVVKIAMSEYVSTGNLGYEYKLEGFNEEWIIVPSNNQITYTNLNTGNYTLKVRALYKNGSPQKEINLKINIRPPFYASTGAYILYFTLLGLIILFYIHFKINKTKLQTSLEFERKDKERIKELNNDKLRFFTNISHEFRTPLTLIIGQIEILLGPDNIKNPSVYKKLLQIYKNTTHLRSLITELLDFRKYEQGYYKLKVQQTNLVYYIQSIYETFQEYAAKLNIKYTYEYTEKDIPVYIDPAQFQKAIFNLLSNAFKYTAPEGSIKIKVQRKSNGVVISVEDSGAGIPSESLTNIFNRFYQIEYRSSGLSMGTGIGLALTKEIVTGHKGTISVESAVNKGSIFYVNLSLGCAHFSSDEIQHESSTDSHIITDEILIFPDMENEAETDEMFAETGENTENPSILIVEDNDELLDILKEAFSPYYNVYTASNGKEGFEMALEKQPDIIVSDVMMGGMSGKEMCYKIKNNINISHIPVVLLTAQTSATHIIEGYMFGADDYVTKPFNINILISRCNNLIKSRKQLYQRAINQSEFISAVSSHDQQLIKQTTEIIRANFSNPKFDMNMLGIELGMGRSKLYTIIKKITGLTPNEFALSIKLKDSLKLLEEEKHLNISDIAYQMGFSSTKYFSKCFKDFFGVSPLNYRRIKVSGDKLSEEEEEE
ncbi:MAG: response regulator [Prevotellaceae bacterium]|nr:response regulator [Prevotellaceae bacterium]